MSRKRKTRPDSTAAEMFFGRSEDPRRARKDAQLCAQVAEALRLALADSDDPTLSDLWIVEVAAAPHIGHLRVVAMAPDDADLDGIHARLTARTAHLRHQVAGAIHRKKTPSLSFVVVPERDVDAGYDDLDGPYPDEADLHEEGR